MCHKNTADLFTSQGDTVSNRKIKLDTKKDQIKTEGLILIKEALSFFKDPYAMTLLLPLTYVYSIKLLAVHIFIIVALVLLD